MLTSVVLACYLHLKWIR